MNKLFGHQVSKFFFFRSLSIAVALFVRLNWSRMMWSKCYPVITSIIQNASHSGLLIKRPVLTVGKRYKGNECRSAPIKKNCNYILHY